MHDQNARYARLRHTATGALAALVAVGAIAGAVALANPAGKPHGHAAAATGAQTKTPPPGTTSPCNTSAPQPAPDPQPFINAVQQLVDNGTITAAQGQTVDGEIRVGHLDTETLTAQGFTASQLQALQQALGNAKQALAAHQARASK